MNFTAWSAGSLVVTDKEKPVIRLVFLYVGIDHIYREAALRPSALRD
jgi:hypothetical protein